MRQPSELEKDAAVDRVEPPTSGSIPVGSVRKEMRKGDDRGLHRSRFGYISTPLHVPPTARPDYLTTIHKTGLGAEKWTLGFAARAIAGCLLCFGQVQDGGPGQSRTADQRFRKPLLYPSELQGRCEANSLSHAEFLRQEEANRGTMRLSPLRMRAEECEFHRRVSRPPWPTESLLDG